MTRAWRTLSTGVVAMALQGCVFRPEVVYVAPEPGCTYRAREMVLKMDYARGGGCSGHHGCASYLVVVGAVSAASMVVSGSIVVVGNVIYWLERQGKCLEPDSSAVP